MRELEFLPDWYPRMRHRKRMVVLQAWISLALVAGLGSWMLLVRNNLRSAQASLTSLRIETAQTQQQLHALEQFEQAQKQLRQKDQILSRLGLHVEATRMLNMIEGNMPAGMSLVEMSFDVEETQPRAAVSLAPSAVAKVDQAPNRTLKVRLKGLAPTDADLAGFLTRLTNVPFLSQVAMTYAKEKIDAGHVMREFQVTFAVDLSRSDVPSLASVEATSPSLAPVEATSPSLAPVEATSSSLAHAAETPRLRRSDVPSLARGEDAASTYGGNSR